MYYGGFTQQEVKPTPDSPLLRLGIDKIPPLVTTAVLLDARSHVGGGESMSAGQYVTPEHIDGLLFMMGPLYWIMIYIGLGFAFMYRINKTRHAEILEQLETRRATVT